ncbi:unnamed protein product [Bursaphelenchus okinawaensis]|uniref:Uncharacterized protein n=1 Tax=Bursaphelenchus okinawaensis TaxID=465554 RepID=A0A811KEG9_9BILA|nr:unnamed protein product [Bursaphelenchus okinawaensis]CAG9101724.1 unnamed protein product [Bursaphelenchus okinawaensis]
MFVYFWLTFLEFADKMSKNVSSLKWYYQLFLTCCQCYFTVWYWNEYPIFVKASYLALIITAIKARVNRSCDKEIKIVEERLNEAEKDNDYLRKSYKAMEKTVQDKEDLINHLMQKYDTTVEQHKKIDNDRIRMIRDMIDKISCLKDSDIELATCKKELEKAQSELNKLADINKKQKQDAAKLEQSVLLLSGITKANFDNLVIKDKTEKVASELLPPEMRQNKQRFNVQDIQTELAKEYSKSASELFKNECRAREEHIQIQANYVSKLESKLFRD